MRRKGFTLVELLVVIAVIALLMGILMPALARVRQIAQRIMCGTNLSGIAKAMQVYANDYQDDLPRAGSSMPQWGTDGCIGGGVATIWAAQLRDVAYPGPIDDITISCSLYLLVRYADVTVSQFICNGDSGTKPLELSAFPTMFAGLGYSVDFVDLWDFGSYPGKRCSYSYHMPYAAKVDNSALNIRMGQSFTLTSTSDSDSPVCADRNPYLDMNAENYVDGMDAGEDPPRWIADKYYDKDKTGNAYAHQREGQNVMYVDSHVAFARYPNCGINNDNIYHTWLLSPPPTPEDKELGLPIEPGGLGDAGIGPGMPAGYKDAYLVNEYQLRGTPES